MPSARASSGSNVDLTAILLDGTVKIMRNFDMPNPKPAMNLDYSFKRGTTGPWRGCAPSETGYARRLTRAHEPWASCRDERVPWTAVLTTQIKPLRDLVTVVEGEAMQL